MKKIGFFLSSFLLISCLLADKDFSPAGPDPYPKPVGDKIIPFPETGGIFYQYRYVETDAEGTPAERIDVKLFVNKKGPNLYGYAFEDSSRGLLLLWREEPRDSMGVYLVGSFDEFGNHFADTLLWLPQFREPQTWSLGTGNQMELVTTNGSILTNRVTPQSGGYFPLQTHQAHQFREIRQDTVTVYHFKRGIGCLHFERSVKGKLHSVGTLTQYYLTHQPNQWHQNWD